jgi:hypothetical protein
VVVHLGEVRDLLKRWDEVRKAMTGQKVKGFAITLLTENDEERVFLGGAYQKDSEKALKAFLSMSIELNHHRDFLDSGLA